MRKIQPTKNPSAAIIAIGDELLSGRTRDKNINHLAKLLTLKGITLLEVRIIADDSAAIVAAVNELRANHQFVFTSGGIGPTHDDITSDAIAQAFGVGIDYNEEAFSLLDNHYRVRGMAFTKARQKMARIPIGAALIENVVSVAPGFKIENVYVLAGVPSVFNAMVQTLESELTGGEALLSFSIDSNLGEGSFGEALGEIAARHKDVSIGSYPRFDRQTYATQIVVRSLSREAAQPALDEINHMLADFSDNLNE